ncbi:MAG: metallophosphoesterase [Lachnospiraceae bacterium]|nr:metallophosphoesterase [Lachnospiraceae bacterium]
MKIIVVSDTHRHAENFFKVIDMHHPDMVVHCGDIEGQERIMSEYAGCPMMMVSGNNDYFSTLSREQEFNIGKYRIWLTHGHNYYVSMDPDIIKKEAVAKRMDIVMYGHTHKPLVDIDDEITAINPGSLAYPRQEGRRPSYIIMEMDRNEALHYTIAYL